MTQRVNKMVKACLNCRKGSSQPFTFNFSNISNYIYCYAKFMPHFASLYYGIMPLKSNNTLTKFTCQEFPAVSPKSMATFQSKVSPHFSEFSEHFWCLPSLPSSLSFASWNLSRAQAVPHNLISIWFIHALCAFLCFRLFIWKLVFLPVF